MQGSHAGRAKLLARLSAVGAVLFLLAGAASGGPPPSAFAAPSGALSMSPGNSSINNGDDISITLDVVGGANVHRVLLNITFNPVVVQAVDANSGAGGVQILPGAFPGTTIVGSVLQNTADNSGGSITYEYTLSSSSAQTSGSGTVATVQFNAIAAGNANIQWTSAQFTDNASASSGPSSSTSAVLMVGQAVATSTATRTGTPTETPEPTETPTPTETPLPSDTETPAATKTPDGTATLDGSETKTPTRTSTSVPTPPASSTPTSTKTPAGTATPKVTVIQDSNQANPPQSGVDPSGKTPALPAAGSSGPGIQWWRWIFFLAALMLAVAGWFFTFALHYGDKEPVLVDRGDRRRRRRY